MNCISCIFSLFVCMFIKCKRVKINSYSFLSFLYFSSTANREVIVTTPEYILKYIYYVYICIIENFSN